MLLKETTTSSSAALVVLAGAATPGNAFSSALPIGATIPNVCVQDNAGNWEIGNYTLTGTKTLIRQGIVTSSNGGAAVVFAAGQKTVTATVADSATLTHIRQSADAAGVNNLLVNGAGVPMGIQRPNTAILFGDSIASMNYSTSNAGTVVTSVGNVATVNLPNHGLTSTSQEVIIQTATDPAFNGIWQVASIIDNSNFTVVLDSAPTITTGGAGTQVCVPNALVAGGFFNWLNFYMKQPFTLLSNQGVGGHRTSDLLARINKAAELQAGHVFILAGINDLINSVPPDTVVANLVQMYQTFLNRGASVKAMTIFPLGVALGTATPAVIAGINYVNRKIKQYCEVTEGMVLFDSHSAIVDPTSTSGYAVAAYLYDGLHPSPTGAQAVGKLGASLPGMTTIPVNTALISNSRDSYALDTTSKNVANNPLFVTTGGSIGTNVTAAATDVAAGWRVDTGGGGSQAATASLVARTLANNGDVLGNNQQAVFTSVANNDNCTIKSFVTYANQFVAGDTLQGECDLIASNMTNIKSLAVYLAVVIGGVTYTYMAMALSSGSTPSNAFTDFKGVIRTPKFKIPAGTITSGAMNVVATFAGAGGCTMQVGRAGIIKQ